MTEELLAITELHNGRGWGYGVSEEQAARDRALFDREWPELQNERRAA